MGESMRVFVSYRRQDARHVAGRLADRLVERFQVFMDMDTIEPGTDFTDVIRQAVEDCDVFLSVIGPQWMAVAGRGRPAPAGRPERLGGRRDRGRTAAPGAGDPGAGRRRHHAVPRRSPGRAGVAGQPPGDDHPPRVVLLRREPADRRHRAPAGHRRHSVDPAGPAPARRSTRPWSRPTTPQPWPPSSAIAGRRRSTGSNACSGSSPQHAGARDRLVEARRHLQLSTWNSQADHAAAEGRWSDAVVLLENIRSLDPNYPDLTRRLQAATAKRRVADLQTDIRSLAAAGQWAAVVAAGQELAAVDSSRADPDGLVSRAQRGARPSRLRRRCAPGGAGGPLAPPASPQWCAVSPRRRPRRRESVLDLGGGRGRRRGRGRGDRRRRGRAGRRARHRPGSGPPATVAQPNGPSGASRHPAHREHTSVSTPPPSPSATYDTSELRTHIPADILPTCSDYVPPAGDALEVKLVGALRAR